MHLFTFAPFPRRCRRGTKPGNSSGVDTTAGCGWRPMVCGQSRPVGEAQKVRQVRRERLEESLLRLERVAEHVVHEIQGKETLLERGRRLEMGAQGMHDRLPGLWWAADHPVLGRIDHVLGAVQLSHEAGKGLLVRGRQRGWPRWRRRRRRRAASPRRGLRCCVLRNKVRVSHLLRILPVRLLLLLLLLLRILRKLLKLLLRYHATHAHRCTLSNEGLLRRHDQMRLQRLLWHLLVVLLRSGCRCARRNLRRMLLIVCCVLLLLLLLLGHRLLEHRLLMIVKIIARLLPNYGLRLRLLLLLWLLLLSLSVRHELPVVRMVGMKVVQEAKFGVAGVPRPDHVLECRSLLCHERRRLLDGSNLIVVHPEA